MSGQLSLDVKSGDAVRVITERDDEGRSALHHCCIEGNERAGLSFIMRGAQIDATDNDGLTPLMVACYKGHDNLVAMLLDGLRDNFGRSPLHHATFDGHYSVLNLLSEHGADIRMKDDNGQQPIHYAAYEGHDLTVTKLIQLGADVNCTDNQGHTPLSVASQDGHDKVVKLILEHKAHMDV